MTDISPTEILTGITRASFVDRAIPPSFLKIDRQYARILEDTIQAGLISQVSRSRLPELGVGSAIEPLDALRAYLENREDLKILAEPILEAAKALMAQEEFDIELDPAFEQVQTQLKLL